MDNEQKKLFEVKFPHSEYIIWVDKFKEYAVDARCPIKQYAERSAEATYLNGCVHVWRLAVPTDIANYKARIVNLEFLLENAVCPSCDGSGAIVVEGIGYEGGCCGDVLSNGECCGNPVQVETLIQQHDECQWCYDRSEAIQSAKEE